MKSFFLTGSKRRGFTLMELIVSAGIFGVVLVMAIGVFVHTARIQNENRKLQTVLTESQFVMETVARLVRENRVSYVLAGGGSGTYMNPSAEIFVSTQDGGRTYTFEENIGTRQLDYTDSLIGVAEGLFSDEVDLVNATFWVDPPSEGPDAIPVAHILLETRSSDPAVDRVVRLQTSVSQRLLR